MSEMTLARAVGILEAAERFRRLRTYRPYTKQRQFHALGAHKRERLLMAGNQQGKSVAGGAELSMHLTGIYPDWWKGRRFDHPIQAWAAGITAEQTRDNAQRILFGEESMAGPPQGTGMIPGAHIVDYTYSKGITHWFDTVRVAHVSGGESILKFRAYEQRREKWQGPPIHAIWCDEEPPDDIYAEAQARTTATAGLLYITFTPLLGMTDVVTLFFPEPKGSMRAIVHMTIEDAEHIPAERRREEIEKYKPHERDARVKGIPKLGSGRVFPVQEEMIVVDPFEVPRWWARITGLDLGYDHPTAGAWLAWDRDNDCVYVVDEYKQSEEVIAVHADVLRSRGCARLSDGRTPHGIPVAWPHDASKHESGSGLPVARQYEQKGVLVLPEHAAYPDGAMGLEAGVTEMLDRMKTGRWKVFRHCNAWLEEFRIYHRKDGKIVKERDDLMSASRYGLMMLRYARTIERGRRQIPQSAGSWDPLAIGGNA